jgi:AcrR family transcriptional regulator
MVQAATTTETATATRILEAAEQLFADEGFESVSLRAITQTADVNLAAVNYHFGSKDALIDVVLERYITPINESRLALLDELEKEYEPNSVVPMAKLLRAFLEPFLTHIGRSELSQRLFFKLMGRCMSAPSQTLPDSTLPLFHQLITRYAAAMQRSAPELSEELILWRLNFTFGVLAQTLLHTEVFEQITEGRAGRSSPETMLNRIIDYTTAGFTTPEGSATK